MSSDVNDTSQPHAHVSQTWTVPPRSLGRCLTDLNCLTHGVSPTLSHVRQASSLEVKQLWVKRLRELIQETCFRSSLPLQIPPSPSKKTHKTSR